jgi:hypothetical protein
MTQRTARATDLTMVQANERIDTLLASLHHIREKTFFAPRRLRWSEDTEREMLEALMRTTTFVEDGMVRGATTSVCGLPVDRLDSVPLGAWDIYARSVWWRRRADGLGYVPVETDFDVFGRHGQRIVLCPDAYLLVDGLLLAVVRPDENCNWRPQVLEEANRIAGRDALEYIRRQYAERQLPAAVYERFETPTSWQMHCLPLVAKFYGMGGEAGENAILSSWIRHYMPGIMLGLVQVGGTNDV